MSEGCIISEDQKMHLSYIFENITKVLNAIFILNLLVPKQSKSTIFMNFLKIFLPCATRNNSILYYNKHHQRITD